MLKRVSTYFMKCRFTGRYTAEAILTATSDYIFEIACGPASPSSTESSVCVESTRADSR